jgi:perosamine synthetase
MTRDELAERLDQQGIGTGIYYPAIMTEHETYRHHPRIERGVTPVADELAGKVLSLPIHTKLAASDISRITETIKKVQADGR